MTPDTNPRPPYACAHMCTLVHTHASYTQENGTIQIILFLSGKVQREENGRYLLEGKFRSELITVDENDSI